MNSRQGAAVVAALTVIAVCMILIVFNTSAIAATAAGQRAEKAVAQAEAREEIVQVLGRVTEVFDGIGADNGFLVTDGTQLRFVSYDRGSMAAGPGWKPQYLKLVKFGNGETLIAPVTVDQFH